MRKAQICLLLSASTRTTFEDGIMPSEYWILEAQDILKDADISQKLAQNSLPPRQHSRWKLIYACCILRILATFVFFQRTEVASGFPLEIPAIDIGDFDEELRASWYLSITLKHKLMGLFLAKAELFRHVSVICNIAMHYSTEPESPTQLSALPRCKRSIIGELDGCESAISDWRVKYDNFFQQQPEDSQDMSDTELFWFSYKEFMKLTYE